MYKLSSSSSFISSVVNGVVLVLGELSVVLTELSALTVGEVATVIFSEGRVELIVGHLLFLVISVVALVIFSLDNLAIEIVGSAFVSKPPLNALFSIFFENIFVVIMTN